jgi:hypothetical protein
MYVGFNCIGLTVDVRKAWFLPLCALGDGLTDDGRTTDGPRGRRAGIAGVVVGPYVAEP